MEAYADEVCVVVDPLAGAEGVDLGGGVGGDGEAVREAEVDGGRGVGGGHVGLVDGLGVFEIAGVGALGGDHVADLGELAAVGQHAQVVASGGEDDFDSGGVHGFDGGAIFVADAVVGSEEGAVEVDGDGANRVEGGCAVLCGHFDRGGEGGNGGRARCFFVTNGWFGGKGAWTFRMSGYLEEAAQAGIVFV